MKPIDLQESFRRESADFVGEVTPLLVAAERAGNLSAEMASNISRRLHNLKGAALLTGNESAGRLLHLLEPLFGEASEARTRPDFYDTLLTALDLVQKLASPGAQLEPDLGALELRLTDLQRAAEPDPMARLHAEFPGIPPSVLEFLTEAQEDRLLDLGRSKSPIRVVSISFPSAGFGAAATSCSEILRKSGEVISCSSTGFTGENTVGFTYLVATAVAPGELARQLAGFNSSALDAAGPAQIPAPPPPPPPPLPVAPAPPPAPLAPAETDSAAKPSRIMGIEAQMEAIRRRYLTEFPEKLDHISGVVGQLESRPDDPELLNELFRFGHSMKGTAGTLELPEMGRLGAALEDLLTELRAGRLRVTPAHCDLMHDWISAVEKTVQACQAGQPATEPGNPVIDRLGRAAKGQEPGPATPAQPRPAPALATAVAPPAQPVATPQPPAWSVPAGPSAPARTPAPAAAADSLRVGMAKVDAIINMAGELVSRKSALRRICSELRGLYDEVRVLRGVLEPERLRLASGTCGPSEAVQTIERRLGPIAGRLQSLFDTADATTTEVSTLIDRLNEDAIKIRMLPLRQLFQKYPRMVRDVGRSLGREVTLELAGDETEIDKVVLEQLDDPLLHMLRNGIDHGIEPPDERLKAGKPARGTIRLRASHEQGRVVIELSDDGRGLSLEKLGAKAIAAGLVTEERLRELSEGEIRAFIFAPGFTTKQEVTEISGRGVGMDVVQTNIGKLHGHIQILSEPGRGTTFRISLPLTLSVIRGLMIRHDGCAYCVPAGPVQEVLKLSSDQFSQVGGQLATSYRGSVLPVVWLHEILGLPASRSNSVRTTVVVLAGLNRRVGIAVDQADAEEELVVKPLGCLLRSVPNVFGVTIRSRGELAVVLDTEGLVRGAGQVSRRPRPSPPLAEKEARRARVLVVEDSVTSREMISNILEGAGYDVSGAADGSEAWKKLAAEEFDLVVTDLDMPVMDGLELTRRIRSGPSRPDLPVIVVTTLGGDEEKVRGLQAGANAYIVKRQFDQGALLARARELTGSR